MKMKIQSAKAHVEKIQYFLISYEGPRKNVLLQRLEEREEEVMAMEKELENLVKVCLGTVAAPV